MMASIMPDSLTFLLTRSSRTSWNLTPRALASRLTCSIAESSRDQFQLLIIITMNQRKVYEPLLTTKHTELLSLTAISGIILRTEHGESTGQCLALDSEDETDSHGKYIYTSEQSLVEDDFGRYEEQRRRTQEVKVRVEYKKQIERLKTVQLERLVELNRSNSLTQRLGQISRIRDKVIEKRGRIKYSIQYMLIHLTRHSNDIKNQNKQLARAFLYKLKAINVRIKVPNMLDRTAKRVLSFALTKIKNEQRVKKISVRPGKVPEIEDILRAQLQKYNARDKENRDQKSILKRLSSRVPKFI